MAVQTRDLVEGVFEKDEALARLQKRLVDEYEARVEEAADMQQEYRRALAVAHLQAVADTRLTTATMREARAQELASDAERAAAITAGMVNATLARLLAVETDRETLRALVQCSTPGTPT
ncbi:MAG: hypothetical protein ACJ79O_14440 [Myxococcales bacterium]